ncbi:uncharacterized protein LOC115621303 [Scaptodrosophila lebanonensis]|uniref:Uncharacterized protein LOC115621303 n=1 Tax=Drosophila lebanonensis TaxID=7225 RepID=A0A6J2T1J3_DROLE|nr:uncharacterized protein LOC115621303 [Scaptodrosophila lebanonensis]XP_030370776.1 uncharacterized protein LOC115621303 [Scaptodrosophila lebanonensis]
MTSSGYTTITNIVEYDEYLLPGTYLYPMVPTAHMESSSLGCFLQEGALMPWFQPINSSATYVVSPMGVVNYLSDLESHMSIPRGDNLSSGLILGLLQNAESAAQMSQLPGMYEVTEVELVEGNQKEHYSAKQGVWGEQASKYDDEGSTDQKEDEAYASGDENEQPTGANRNVYRAAGGYLVEEPGSEEDEIGKGQEQQSKA